MTRLGPRLQVHCTDLHIKGVSSKELVIVMC